MKTIHVVAFTSVLAAAALHALPLLADESSTKTFAQMAADMPDGKIRKSRVMEVIGKTFDRADTRKEEKLDEKQARQFQQFLKEFTRESGA
ncbi:MAG TPA: hypothetical protein VNU21_15250 [Usitatibacter sp.]|nr:hypothetical protein [Usitatibacter sp.]